MGGETGVRAARLVSGVMGGRYRVRKSVHSRRELRRIMKGAIRERRLTLQRWSDIVEIIIMGSRQYVRERSRVTVLLLRRLPVFDGGPKFVNRRLKSGCCSFLEELLRLLRDDERTAAFGSVTTSTRRPLGGMMMYFSPCRGGGSTISRVDESYV